MQRRKVDLPEPEAPMMQTTLPGADLEVDALQHLDAAVALVDAAGDDHRSGRVPSPGPRGGAAHARLENRATA